jgi:pyruvate dehydrogenase E2 component (dihydrolipoamide acetyltransferase)
MQTDKALVEVPSPWAGTVSEICGKPGDIIKVGAVLVRYGAAAAKPAAAAPAASGGASTNGTGSGAACLSSQVAAGVPSATEDQGTVVGTMSGTLTVSDRFARRAPEAAAVARDGKALATPAVRRIARELGVDIQRVPGSGRNGRVTATDIEQFAGTGAGAAAPAGGGRS